jgi:hypothetical protein
VKNRRSGILFSCITTPSLQNVNYFFMMSSAERRKEIDLVSSSFPAIASIDDLTSKLYPLITVLPSHPDVKQRISNSSIEE